MSSAVNDGQYQGSQAFAHVLPVKGESINPNTGSLSFSKPLVELRGIRPSVDLKINLTYSAGTSGAFGLPRAWALDIPYVVPGKSVTTQGRTYAIDLGWTDDSNYQSGLRYLNNHGMKFEPVVPPQQLPSGHSGEYSYKLQHPDGSIDYFEANGKPLERDDIYGNFIYYGLTASAGGSVLSSEPCLEYILDSWGQKITFEYMPATRMDLVSPDGSRVSANFSEQGVDQITDAAGYQTRCWYTAFNNNQQVLHEIGYPTNLVSRYDYCGLGYFDADHNAKQMPAVQDHYRLDRDGRLLEHTNYSYGTETGGLTYTGAGKGFTMGGLQDTLMEGGDPEYRYDGLKTSLDSSGNTLAAASTVFNYLHLPIEECKYTVDGQAGVRKAFGTTYTYEVSPNKHARTASYAYPTITEQSHNTSLGPGEIWMPLNRTIKAYNPFGNVIRTDVELCSKDSFWIKQKTLAKEYYATKAGIQIPESETVKDEISGSIHLTRNTLCGNEKAIESSTILFTSGQGSSPPETWKIKSYAYDQFGRIIQERLSWAQGAAVPPGSAPSTTRLMEYSLDRGILTESSVDSSENITKVEYDLRKLGGPIVRRTLPMGQIEGFEYDLVGRLVKHTDFLKAVTKTEYNVGGPTNTVKTTSPTGYVEMKMFDALGRVCEVMDNANPTTTLQIPGRTLQRTKYDGRGRLVETTSRFGLITRQSYDALDRQISKTDPLGNVTEYYHDDTHLRVRETLNGDLRKLIQLDGAAQAISETNFADSSDTSVNYCVTVDTIWDGNKRKMNEVTSEKPKGVFNTAAVRKLKQDRKVYDADSLVAFHSMEGLGESGNDIVERQLCRDLFGNVHSYSKKTTYAGGRSYSHNGPVKIYSADNKFVKLQNQLGQEESYHFDQNSWLQKTVRFDGTQITYSRDACGQTTEIVYPTSKTELTYDWKDRLSDVQDGTQKISYEYFLDGALKSTQFGDDRRQTYKLDKTSRIVEEVDVFGVAREYQYDQHGRLSEVSCQGDKLSYVYGVANHTNGQLLGAQLDGKRFIQHFRSYDGFGSTKEVRIQESDSSMLLEATYLMNSRGQLHYANIKSTTCPELNSGRTMLYDGIGQLIQEAKTGSVKSTTSYSYDGNSNVI